MNPLSPQLVWLPRVATQVCFLPPGIETGIILNGNLEPVLLICTCHYHQWPQVAQINHSWNLKDYNFKKSWGWQTFFNRTFSHLMYNWWYNAACAKPMEPQWFLKADIHAQTKQWESTTPDWETLSSTFLRGNTTSTWQELHSHSAT